MGLAEEDLSLALTREVNLDTQLSDISEDERIGQVIPVPDSLGKEAFLIQGVFTCITNLMGH